MFVCLNTHNLPTSTLFPYKQLIWSKKKPKEHLVQSISNWTLTIFSVEQHSATLASKLEQYLNDKMQERGEDVTMSKLMIFIYIKILNQFNKGILKGETPVVALEQALSKFFFNVDLRYQHQCGTWCHSDLIPLLTLAQCQCWISKNKTKNGYWNILRHFLALTLKVTNMVSLTIKNLLRCLLRRT